MNAEQETALMALEAAFLECKKAGLVFAGIDGSLSAVEKSDKFDRLRASLGSCEAVLRSVSYDVETHGTYLDSEAYG